MTSGSSTPEVEYCARHPKVESSLRCSRCETLICPRCMEHTPAGMRCPDCAREAVQTVPEYQGSAGAGEEVCARHPDVPTALRCGRCDTLICPRCMVYTPAGVRCPECAQLRRPPMYELSIGHYLRAVAVTAVLAPLLGVLGAMLLPPRSSGAFFLLFIALLAGMGAGALVAEAITRVTRGKRGLALQVIAAAGLVAAGAIRFIVSDAPLGAVTTDFGGMLLVAAAVVSAWGRLR